MRRKKARDFPPSPSPRARSRRTRRAAGRRSPVAGGDPDAEHELLRDAEGEHGADRAIAPTRQREQRSHDKGRGGERAPAEGGKMVRELMTGEPLIALEGLHALKHALRFGADVVDVL